MKQCFDYSSLLRVNSSFIDYLIQWINIFIKLQSERIYIKADKQRRQVVEENN